MTSSEFVGHIDDINTEYDAIYFGDSYNNWSFLRNGDVDDNNKKTSLYAHIGGVFGGDKDPVGNFGKGVINLKDKLEKELEEKGEFKLV